MSDEAEQCPWSKGALLFVVSPVIRKARTSDKGVREFAGPEAENIRQGEG